MEQRRDALEAVLAEAGECGPLTLAVDWSRTAAGPMRDWPDSVRTAVGICFSACTPTLVGIGPDLVQVYNDEFAPFFGSTKHPGSIGRTWQVNYAEIWEGIGDTLAGVLERGESARADDHPLLMERGGIIEESYFTYSFTPIRDPDGTITGVFCPALETTERVVGDRRMRTLSDLASVLAQARDVDGVVEAAAATLGLNPADLPFCLLYVLTPDGGHARLATTVGLAPGAGGPDLVRLGGEDDGPWPLTQVVRTGEAVDVPALGERLGPLTDLPADDAPQTAVLLPLHDASQVPVGVLVTGISRHRPLDDGYRSFLRLVSGHLETGLAQAAAEQTQRERVEAMAEIDRAKTEFFSNVSHEFRTPLTLMMGPLEEALADAELVLPGRQRERIDTAARNAQRLLKLVNTLLEFSRTEAGRAQATYAPTALSALTRELASVFRSAVQDAGLDYEVDCPDLSEDVFVDVEMWEQVVLNLLSNALKFTFTGSIRVQLRETASHAELVVADTGEGIAPEELPRLFERFHRVRGTRARTHEGSGIGLALVQDLVSLHGGTIEVASTPGRGTTFTVRVPLGHVHLADGQVAASPSLPLRSSTGQRAAYVDAVVHAAGSAPDRADAVTTEGRVLVVDDNEDMLAYVARLLAPHFAVDSAPDGRVALAAALASPPDLVLTDVMMPGLDGFGLLRALREDPATAQVPVIMLSARAGEGAAHEGLLAGADDYLVKPFSQQELLTRVRAHVRTARQRLLAAESARRADDERREREHASRFALLAEGTSDFVGMADPQGRVLSLNRAARQMLGIPLDEDLTHLRMHEVHAPETAAEFQHAVEVVLEEGVWRGDTVLLHRDGHTIPTSQVLLAHRDDQGELVCFGTIIRDMTDEHQASERLRVAEARFRHAFDDAPVGMAILDGGRPGLRIVSANPALRLLVEQSPDSLLGASLLSLIPLADHEATELAVSRLLEGDASSATWQVRMQRADGTDLRASLSASATRPADGPAQVLLHVQDVTERNRFEQRLQHLADHDPLTGLLNRRRLMEELEREVAAARRYATSGALLLVDLDDFKYVNDSLGHAAGDDLLVQASRELTHRLRDTDTLARLGGDEFGVIAPHVTEEQARALACGLLETIRSLAVGARRLTASVGIAVFGPDLDAGTTGEQLLVKADTAMYDAKESGRAQVAVFDQTNVRQTAMEKRLDAAERLREALASERLVLYAQPIVPSSGPAEEHYELLVRMRSESGRLLPPEDFLGVAVQFDLIKVIDRWVVGEAVRLLAHGRALGRSLRLSVNLSAQSILDPDLAEWIAQTVASAGVPGSGLVFEVTETDAAVNYESANLLAERLSALGCGFALDDFGTGFCSLHYIKHLRFDVLKIDGEFVRDLLTSEADQLIVHAAVDIAHGLGRKVVAEGVQDAATQDVLRAMGVDYLQGFHIGRPTPVGELLRVLPQQPVPLAEGLRGR